MPSKSRARHVASLKPDPVWGMLPSKFFYIDLQGLVCDLTLDDGKSLHNLGIMIPENYILAMPSGTI